jgi:DNA (cytosine-5)-methyltransferase 1
MDLGFVQAGHQIVWANDIFPDAVETYRRNLGDHIHLGPMEEVSPLPDAEIVIGGFPCQGFSIANRKRHTGDQRNTLYLQVLRVLREKRPPLFLVENVKGILSLDGGSVFKMIVRDFLELGYSVRYAVLNAADFGVPQQRQRVFVCGVRAELGFRPNFPPVATHADPLKGQRHGMQPWVGVGEALAKLPPPGEASGLPNHAYASGYKLRFNGHLGHRTIDPARPAPTITARGDDRGGVVVIHHPSNSRRVSPREAATIQGFPVDFEFAGANTSAYRQIANAVPVPLARAVAACFPATIFELRGAAQLTSQAGSSGSQLELAVG